MHKLNSIQFEALQFEALQFLDRSGQIWPIDEKGSCMIILVINHFHGEITSHLKCTLCNLN